ncbi:MAG: 4Fe-4S dicluster domain-containing protein [Candidatus Omnitrophica bacterium]|nr:4Fe-4S dicluster domain-containing protein [Candidatus Omnitrophota bacterium]
MSKDLLNKKKSKEVKIFCDITKCVGCKSCEIACAVEHSQSKDIYSVVKESSRPKKRVKAQSIGKRVVSLHCQHCEDAPCVKACMSGALSKDPATGATLHDNDKCVGCWMCVMVCPFGAIVQDVENHIAVKCDLCPDREDFACVAACPTGALFVGTKEEFEKKLKEKAKKE